ncbi:MAG: phosphoglucosamine mutase [Clostridiales bacterium]|nr:phosphoglucosamine mutase [Clostridiales bacterium]
MGRPLTTKYFGTDGIRGKANEFLSAELVLKLGRAAAFLAGEHGGGRMLIGMDTRLSGPLLESALAAGLLAAGVDVYSLGIIPTPGVAALCRVYEAPGAVISASHNPYEDNGIKFFTAQGNKLCDEDQERIEKFLNNPMPPLAETAPGRLYRVEDAAQQYAEIILAAQKPDLSALKLAIDCAHGAASPIAPQLLRSLGAEVVAIGAAPDGRNINAACGSTAPKLLCQTVLEEKAQIGMALDGDADRLIAVDETGNIVDGDVLLVIMARYLQSKGQLPHNTIVVTQMCNMALRQKLTQLGITIVEARVGDRYVLEKMQKSGALLGGEQSGHIILSCFNSTGDALAAAIFLLTILAEQGCSLASLTADLRLFAQVHINVAVKTKKGFEKDRKISAAIIAAQKELAGQGRVIVRASGTEPLFRVMTEGPDEEVLQRLADDIAKAIRAGLG